jgi:hypothetical protein
MAMGVLVLLGWWFGGDLRTTVPDNAASSAAVMVSVNPTNAVAPLAVTSDSKIPQEIARDNLEPAARDPFTYVAAALPPVPKKLPPAPVVVPPAPIIMAAPAPSAPQHNLRFTGRMTTPDGQQLIFATLADAPITLAVGQNLANGYRVDSITDRVVQLTYVALGTSARLDLPEPPRYETR